MQPWDTLQPGIIRAESEHTRGWTKPPGMVGDSRQSVIESQQSMVLEYPVGTEVLQQAPIHRALLHPQAQMQHPNSNFSPSTCRPEPTGNIYQQIAGTLQQLHLLTQLRAARGETHAPRIPLNTLIELATVLGTA